MIPAARLELGLLLVRAVSLVLLLGAHFGWRRARGLCCCCCCNKPTLARAVGLGSTSVAIPKWRCEFPGLLRRLRLQALRVVLRHGQRGRLRL